MGLFDFLTGTKKPKSDAPALPQDKVAQAIMAVNRDTAPFQIIACEDASCDFIAEWRIVDAKWVEIFANAGLKKVFRIKMRLDATKNEVRSVDQEYTLSWRAGIPTLKLAVSGFRGQKTETSGGLAYAFTETGAFGEVYKYRFTSAEMKKPLQTAVTDAGWTWRGVSFAKL